MKTLLIIRHAKSSWDNANTADIDRTLNDRGKKDAPVMARRLIKTGIVIDRFVSSPAKRARHTAELFAREFGIKDKDIVIIPDLYHAAPSVFRQIITDLNDKDDTVALFSHNPGITSFVNTMASLRLDNMPTCAIFAVKSTTGHWSEFLAANPEFLFFDYPKSAASD
jgi:phosphohistidine phosphatase